MSLEVRDYLKARQLLGSSEPHNFRNVKKQKDNQGKTVTIMTHGRNFQYVLDCFISPLQEVSVCCRMVYTAIFLLSMLFLSMHDCFIYLYIYIYFLNFILFIPCTVDNQFGTLRPTKCTILFLRYLYYIT
jgi:hypothetical protein